VWLLVLVLLIAVQYTNHWQNYLPSPTPRQTKAFYSLHYLEKIENIQPTYPNYTLSVANRSQHSLRFQITPLSYLTPPQDLQMAYEQASSQNTSGTIANSVGTRRWSFSAQWLTSGLTPSTNYTAFVLQNNSKVGGLVLFATKPSR
jgi:calcium channel MID1